MNAEEIVRAFSARLVNDKLTREGLVRPTDACDVLREVLDAGEGTEPAWKSATEHICNGRNDGKCPLCYKMLADGYAARGVEITRLRDQLAAARTPVPALIKNAREGVYTEHEKADDEGHSRVGNGDCGDIVRPRPRGRGEIRADGGEDGERVVAPPAEGEAQVARTPVPAKEPKGVHDWTHPAEDCDVEGCDHITRRTCEDAEKEKLFLRTIIARQRERLYKVAPDEARNDWNRIVEAAALKEPEGDALFWEASIDTRKRMLNRAPASVPAAKEESMTCPPHQVDNGLCVICDASVPAADQPLQERTTMKFAIGDLLRYSGGPTALFRVTAISPNHGGAVRYYGNHCMGGAHGAYESECTPASDEDVLTWEKHRKGRR